MMQLSQSKLRDEELAQMLGYQRPRVLRALIRDSLSALQQLGDVQSVIRQPENVKEFWLNPTQVFYILTKSTMPAAHDLLMRVLQRHPLTLEQLLQN